MSVLVVEQLEKWWDESSGLRALSFSIDAGELVVARGRSGSGKSTLLALIVGWCQPDGGSVVVNAQPSSEEPAWSAVTIVPQVLGLVPELTIRENIVEAVHGSGAAGGTTDGWASVDEVLESLDLTEFADRSPADTSMGQQQRVAIGRAIVGRPRLVLADEPTSHQGSDHVAAVVAALANAARQGSAVLVATHDDAIIAAATRVIELTAGTR